MSASLASDDRALALAVIHQAIVDLESPEPQEPDARAYPKKSVFRGKIKVTSYQDALAGHSARLREWKNLRGDAISFLTHPTGQWARSRQAWCDLADIDPEAVRSKAGAILRESAVRM